MFVKITLKIECLLNFPLKTNALEIFSDNRIWVEYLRRIECLSIFTLNRMLVEFHWQLNGFRNSVTVECLSNLHSHSNFYLKTSWLNFQSNTNDSRVLTQNWIFFESPLKIECRIFTNNGTLVELSLKFERWSNFSLKIECRDYCLNFRVCQNANNIMQQKKPFPKSKSDKNLKI